MRYRLKIEGDVLSFEASAVPDTMDARGRMCNMEMALLRHYGWHTSEPVGKMAGLLVFHYWRRGSDHKLYHECRKILEGFNIEWLDGANGVDRSAS